MGEAAVPPELGESWGRPRSTPAPLAPLPPCGCSSPVAGEEPEVPGGLTRPRWQLRHSGWHRAPMVWGISVPGTCLVGHSTPVGTSGCPDVRKECPREASPG